jgi:hypothetical protein
MLFLVVSVVCWISYWCVREPTFQIAYERTSSINNGQSRANVKSCTAKAPSSDGSLIIFSVNLQRVYSACSDTWIMCKKNGHRTQVTPKSTNLGCRSIISTQEDVTIRTRSTSLLISGEIVFQIVVYIGSFRQAYVFRAKVDRTDCQLLFDAFQIMLSLCLVLIAKKHQLQTSEIKVPFQPNSWLLSPFDPPFRYWKFLFLTTVSQLLQSRKDRVYDRWTNLWSLRFAVDRYLP